MDRVKLEERRHGRQISSKSVRLGNSLSANYLRLGAGVSLSMMSWAILGGFVTAEGPSDDAAATRQLTSEIRLKSMESTIALTPIGNLSSVMPPARAPKPHASKIQLNPLTGDSLETLDQPIFAGSHTENIQSKAIGNKVSPSAEISINGSEPATLSSGLSRNAVDTSASGSSDAKHPQILSIRRLNLQPFCETPVHAVENKQSDTAGGQPEKTLATDLMGDMSPGILVHAIEIKSEPELASAIAFSFTDAASSETADHDDLASLPLLPLSTNQHSVADDSMGPEAEKQLAQRNSNHNGDLASNANIPKPPKISIPQSSSKPQSISVSQVKRLSTTHGGLSSRRESASVPASLSRFIRPARTTQQPQVKAPTLAEDVALLMEEVRDRYPNARVVLASEDGVQVMRGTCRNRKEATAIIRLIRSRLLIPVDDQMIIR